MKTLALSALLAAALLLEPAAPLGSSVPPPAPPAPVPLAQSFAAEAEALRRGDCTTALRLVRARAAAGTALGETARLLHGFYAHACADVETAESTLFAAAHAGGSLEDWRLYLLADSAAARGHAPAAAAALNRLLTDHPASPLRPRAFARAAELAAGGGDATRALELVARGRAERPLGAEASRLEALAWEIAAKRGDVAAQREAARRLLVHAPFEAARLQVIELFRPALGTLDWSAVLQPRDLEARAARLIELGVHDGALAALDAIAAGERGTRWRLLRARALTMAGRGEEALRLLAGLEPETAVLRAQLEWARAAAVLDLATARTGRANLPAERRQALRESYRRHLWQVARLDADRGLAREALRQLFAELADERFDEAMSALTLLRQLDPLDTTGAGFLWERGWREFRRGDPAGAVGHWSRLGELYPDSRWARAGAYWTARALERLGERQRAKQLYTEIAGADTTDFYRKHALARLGVVAVITNQRPVPARGAWPHDPLLERARLLTDLGLDDLALAELDGWGERADAPAALALRALVTARRGDRRDSIRLLREAFPGIGGPHQATLPEEALRLFYPLAYERTIRASATRQGLEPAIVFGMIHQESGFDAAAVSRSGARGLMQVMPATGRELARKLGLPYSTGRLTDPDLSVRLGTHYFRQVLQMFDGDVELALAGYNGGPYRIRRLWRDAGERDVDAFLEDLTIEESKSYVKRILVVADSYRQLYPAAGGRAAAAR